MICLAMHLRRRGEVQGVIAWHDYSAEWPGVFRYLVELSRGLPLVHIAGTTLVVYRSAGHMPLRE
jgi:hypothetical protein